MPGPSLSYLNWPMAVPGNFQRAHPPMVYHESLNYIIRSRGRPRIRFCGHVLEMSAVTRWYVPDILTTYAGLGFVMYNQANTMLQSK